MQAVISLTFILTSLVGGEKEISYCECEEECLCQNPCTTECCDDEDWYEEECDEAVFLDPEKEKTPIKDFFFKSRNKKAETAKNEKAPIRDFFFKNSTEEPRNPDWDEPCCEQECCSCAEEEN